MDDLWKKQGKDLKMTVYNVVPTEYNKVKDVVSLIIVQGMIEFVPDAITVCKLQAEEASKRANGDITRSPS